MGGRLDGKRALITGAGSGIGLATARRFVSESNLLQLRPLIDRILPMDEYVAGFELGKSHRGQKILSRPSASAAS